MSREPVPTLLREWLSTVYLHPAMRFVPLPPVRFRRRYLPPEHPWFGEPPVVPESLKSRPGIERVPADEDDAFESAPLEDFSHVNGKAMLWLRGAMWRVLLPVAPRMWRARTAAKRANLAEPAVAPRPDVSTTALTRSVREKARKAGLSAIGVAALDERYMFAEWQGTECGDRVVVCVLEQNHAATQTIPSSTAEMTALSTYAELMRRSVELADFLTAEGFRARVHDPLGRGVAIHYAVEAGLGQLGLNGQLLTPAAGSRCRILLLNTDAPLNLDRPADYGIPNLCDECQICVRRCPPGAIPLHRAHHRGVLKSKINTKRCFPVVAQVRGCAICMKVCPVQRYGLRAVFEEYERSGEILGKGTDELEGFDWPPDGQRYGPGEKPRMTDELMFPPGFELGITAGPGHFDHPDTSGRTWA